MGKLLSDIHPIVDAVQYGPSEGKKRKVDGPDKLAQDAAEARKAGVSYGRWMASQAPVKIVKPEPVEVEPDIESAGYIRMTCLHCSKEFVKRKQTRQVYCGRPCRDAARYQNQKKIRQERERSNEDAGLT